MQPYRILDPRSPLDRLNRDQLREYAERNGITEITWDMTGDEMRYLLKKRGINDIGAPLKILGTQSEMTVKPEVVPTISLEDLQRQQWEQRAKEREEKAKIPVTRDDKWPVENMTRASLAKLCKRRGIKMQRTDTKEKLIERLNGESHAA